MLVGPIHRKSPPENKDTSKSLDICHQFKRDKTKLNEESKNNNDDTNSNSVSLIRIKSEHNLKEERDPKAKNLAESKKEKTYNSKNFFTENFDDQEMEDAINRIKSNPDFETSTPSPTKLRDNMPSDEKSNDFQNIEFSRDEESISFDEGNWKIDLGQTLNRKNEHKIKAIIESANADYNNLMNNTLTKPKASGAILVNDHAEDEARDQKDELAEESSVSDNLDLSKNVDLKKEGFFKITNKFDRKEQESKQAKHTETQVERSAEKASELESAKHSKSLEELKENETLHNNTPPISSIDIERIGSPNKPKHLMEGISGRSNQPRDSRYKIDDDEDEEGIITGSHTIDNSAAKKSLQGIDIKENLKIGSMTEYFKYSKVVKEDNLTGDIKDVIDGICQNLIAELDKELFPQRPLFLLTADLSGITLDQATTLLNDLTPEKERMIVEKIIERQTESSRKKKAGKIAADNGKLVLYEKKGIRTDLVAIENYVEALYMYLDKHKKKQFMKTLFTAIKHDPFEMLNQLQNSDIGSYEHFEVDMNLLAVLQLDTYLEMENYWRQLDREEEKVQELDKDGKTVDSKSKSLKSRSKRKRFEFDETGLTEKQLHDKKKLFRECEHIHNKALFD